MLSCVTVPTAVVVMVKFALTALAGTVTVSGTVVEGSLLARLTTAPAAGAGPLKVTVPWALVPPTTIAGFTVTCASVGGGLLAEAVPSTFNSATEVHGLPCSSERATRRMYCAVFRENVTWIADGTPAPGPGQFVLRLPYLNVPVATAVPQFTPSVLT